MGGLATFGGASKGASRVRVHGRIRRLHEGYQARCKKSWVQESRALYSVLEFYKGGSPPPHPMRFLNLSGRVGAAAGCSLLRPDSNQTFGVTDPEGAGGRLPSCSNSKPQACDPPSWQTLRAGPVCLTGGKKTLLWVCEPPAPIIWAEGKKCRFFQSPTHCSQRGFESVPKRAAVKQGEEAGLGGGEGAWLRLEKAIRTSSLCRFFLAAGRRFLPLPARELGTHG